MINHPQVTLKAANDLIMTALGIDRIPMLHGSPGMGKTSTLQQIAEDQNLLLRVISLKMYDPTTMAGVLRANDDLGKAELLPTDLFIFDNEDLPDNPATGQPYDGVLLFFDEVNTVSMTMQSTAYGIMEERRVGVHNLHPDTYIVAAGNHVTDQTGAFPLGPAMQTRMFHISLRSDVREFLDYAVPKGLDHRIADFLNHSPSSINDISQSKGQLTYPCERTWERSLSPSISHIQNIDNDSYPLIAASVGNSAALDFINYCQVYANLPSITELLQNPGRLNMQTAPGEIVAIMGMIARHDNKQQVGMLINSAVANVGPDYQSYFAQQLVRVMGTSARSIPEFQQLAQRVSSIMY